MVYMLNVCYRGVYPVHKYEAHWENVYQYESTLATELNLVNLFIFSNCTGQAHSGLRAFSINSSLGHKLGMQHTWGRHQYTLF